MWEGTRFIFVPKVELFCPEGEFLSWGPAHFEFFRWTKNEVWVNRKNSKWAGPKDKNSPKGQKSSTWGTKINLVPSLGIPKCFCFLSKTNKIENKLSSWKKEQKIHWPRQKKACKWWKLEKNVFVWLFLFASATSYFKLRETWQQSFILILTLSSRSSFFWPGYFSF